AGRGPIRHSRRDGRRVEQVGEGGQRLVSRDRGGQTVLTTGANSGLGLATVLAVARAGYRSVGTVRTEAEAKVVTEAAAAVGRDACKSGSADEGPRADADTDPRCASAMDRTQKGRGMMGFLWSDPEKVASVITTAIGARFPRPRYVVGRDARLSLLTEPFAP